jgi:hypothetical protein
MQLQELVLQLLVIRFIWLWLRAYQPTCPKEGVCFALNKDEIASVHLRPESTRFILPESRFGVFEEERG